ncbi:MAG TPA: FecR family protein, partial [Blastocatellia bacterium]|nr:FecR family protein [Blastocatellia bacterium]
MNRSAFILLSIISHCLSISWFAAGREVGIIRPNILRTPRAIHLKWRRRQPMMIPALYFIRSPAIGSGRAGFVIALFIAVSLNLVTISSNAGPFDQTEQFRCLTRGGMINAVEGEVMARIDRKDWQKAYARIELRNGDRIKTGFNSRAELLLNPGSFLRLSENTEVVYTDTSATNLKLRLIKGEAIIEVAVNDMVGHLDSAHSLITVLTSKAEYAILPGGIYRFGIDAGGSEEVKVRKGRIVVNGAIVREGKRAVITNGTPVIYDFDRDESDSFDEWSRARAKLLVQINKSMKDEEWY